MAIRLTKSERVKIESNRDLIDQIANADFIRARHIKTSEEWELWRRPMTEVVARGLPGKVRVLTFELSSEAELREYQQIVGRLKASDSPAEPANGPQPRGNDQ